MDIGSLFAGIGGLEKGLEASGLGRVIWQVEQDQFCRTILAKHWPDADRSVCDVRLATASVLRRVDILCGGFPCQDVSAAGAGAGLSGARSGLWYEYHRAVLDLRPRAVVVENVASGASRWLVPVRRMLETSGYRTRAISVAASDVGAPHRRSRIFVIGLADADRLRVAQSQGHLSQSGRRSLDGGQTVADAMRSRREGTDERGKEFSNASGCSEALADAHGFDVRLEQGRRPRTHGADPSLTGGAQPIAQSNMGRNVDGLPAGLDLPARWPAGQGAFQYEWEPPRTIPKGSDPNRRARLKALGNAVVPHCGYVAGRALLEWMSEVQP